MGESGDTPLREMIMMATTPGKGLSGSSSGGNKESKSALPASRAVSWFEHAPQV